MSFSIQNKSRALRELKNKLFNSRFFTLSVLFHLVLVLGLGGTVIIQQATEPSDFTGGDPESKFVQNEVQPVKPAVETPRETPAMTPTVQTTKTLDVITANAPTMTPFQMPAMAQVVPVTTADPSKVITPTIKQVNPGQLTPAQAQAIRKFATWAKGPGGPGTSPKEREFEFNAYLAKYAGGDWASTNVIQNGQITKGSLPNLLYFMANLSKGKIKANPIAEPLDLSSQDIFIKKPPFIFFTGHKDFVLTDKEVENLQKYVQVGGCIWGDSSLPGLRSRFDLAFRREMRRVIPDADKEWEALPPDYPMFKKNLYYAEVAQPPPGVNYYKESVYALRFGGEVAIIYTPNDYGDMWRLALHYKPGEEKKGDAGLEIDTTRIERTWTMKFTDDSVFYRMEMYYRGMELPKLINSYKFGTNVVIHLLTRWEDRLKTVPQGL
ncbi:MAG: DUF4159 domain-containing protein [Chthoniobacteraceae bacterium]|nr:DUF4159 domain-containing protein [Chthoniobacteraceae bacterium]